MLKRLLALALPTAALLGACACTAPQADHEAEASFAAALRAGDAYVPAKGEQQFDFDGGTLYYADRNGKIAVTWVGADTEELYLPAEIDGKPVTAVERISGRAAGIHYPNSIVAIDRGIGPVEGVKTIEFGYEDGPCALERISGGLDKPETLERIVFNDSIDDIGCMGCRVDMAGFPSSAEVVNPPHQWSDGIESHEKLLAMLGRADAADYVSPQSEKVAALAAEITAGATTDEERVYKICEWVCENISYDTFVLGGRETDDYGNPIVREQEAEQVIDNRIAVCEGYSKLTRALCNAVGIPAAYVSGDLAGSSHAWNAICVDGRWGIYDNTESDSGWNADLSLRTPNAPTGGITYEEYLQNDELKADFTWEELQEAISASNGSGEDEKFASHHPYYDASPAKIGANQIAKKVNGTPIE